MYVFFELLIIVCLTDKILSSPLSMLVTRLRDQYLLTAPRGSLSTLINTSKLLESFPSCRDSRFRIASTKFRRCRSGLTHKFAVFIVLILVTSNSFTDAHSSLNLARPRSLEQSHSKPLLRLQPPSPRRLIFLLGRMLSNNSNRVRLQRPIEHLRTMLVYSCHLWVTR